VLVIALTIVVIDIPRGNPQWYREMYSAPGTEIAPPATGEEGTDITPIPMEESLMDVTGHTSEGQSTSEGFTITDVNTTQLSATLIWTDDIGDNDHFSLSLVYEGDSVETVSSTTGSVDLVFNAISVGEYQFIVTAMDCPGEVGILPVDRDNGNDWHLVASVTVMVYPEEEA